MFTPIGNKDNTADSIASVLSGVIMKELQRHDAVHKASDENRFCYPGGVFTFLFLVSNVSPSL